MGVAPWGREALRGDRNFDLAHDVLRAPGSPRTEVGRSPRLRDRVVARHRRAIRAAKRTRRPGGDRQEQRSVNLGRVLDDARRAVAPTNASRGTPSAWRAGTRAGDARGGRGVELAHRGLRRPVLAAEPAAPSV